MTGSDAGQPGGSTAPSDLTDPGSKTQPAEGGRDEAEDGFDPESSGETASAGTGDPEERGSEPRGS